MTASSPLFSFTHGRKDVGIVLSDVSVVLLNISAWCLVSQQQTGCLLAPLGARLVQHGAVAPAPSWAKWTKHFGGSCRRFKEGPLLLKAQHRGGSRRLEGTPALRQPWCAALCDSRACQSRQPSLVAGPCLKPPHERI